MPDVRDPQTYALIGAAMEVHSKLGCGFLEAVYQQAMAIEMTMRSVPYLREVHCPVMYKGHRLDCPYRSDFIAFGEVIVEIKATKGLTDVDKAQAINYLKATGYGRAILLNFGVESLEFERIVLNYKSASA